MGLPPYVREIRYALRRVAQAPGFFVVAAVLIGIGVAAHTTIFGVVDAVILRPLPVRNPENLVQLFEVRPNFPDQANFFGDLRQLIATDSETLEQVTGEFVRSTRLELDTVTSNVYLGLVPVDYFEILGVGAALGRVFDASDGDPRIAVLSHDGWQRHFGGDPNVVGRVVRLGAEPYRVIGVTSQGFNGTRMDAGPEFRVPEANRNLFGEAVMGTIVGRLDQEASLTAANDEIRTLWSAYRAELLGGAPSPSAFDRELSVAVRSIARGTSPLRDTFETTLLTLLAGTTTLIVMVGLNVGALLVSRQIARGHETAVRLAVGARPRHIVGGGLAEGILVASFGGALGMAISGIAGPVVLEWLSSTAMTGVGGLMGPPPTVDISAARATFLVLGTTAFVAAISSLVPLNTVRCRNLEATLRARSASPGVRALQKSLTVAQVAMAAVLLLGGTLMVRTLLNFQDVDPGFDRERIVRFSIDTVLARYDGPGTWRLQERLLGEVQQIPGVEAAGLNYAPVMQGVGLVTFAVFPGQPLEDDSWNTNINNVTPGYFDAMGIDLLTGAFFDPWTEPGDELPTPVVVNETFAGRFLDGEDPVGRVFGTGTVFQEPQYRIVGVVSDANYRTLRESNPPMFYVNPFGPENSNSGFNLIVRAVSPEAVIAPVRDLVRAIDPALPTPEAFTMTDEIARSLWQERLVTALAVSFCLFGLTIAAIGLYGVLANHVASRRRDIGIRLALGANRRRIVRLVATRAVVVLAMGFGVGTAVFVLVGSSLESLLFGVTFLDAVSIFVAIGVVLLVGAAAAAVPVARALSIDPSVVLRIE